MSGPLFWRTLAWERTRWLLVSAALFGWGVLIPVIYTAFSDAIRDLANSGAIPQELLSFGSGSLFSLPGAVTLGTQHPIAIALVAVFAVGSASVAIAGERQRGTLEVLLARPLTRTAFYVTVLVALLIVIAVALLALLAGFVTGATIRGVSADLSIERMPLVLLNGFLLWGAFATFALGASATFDRVGPATGLALAWVLVHYFLEILGSLWRDVAWTQEYSLFHHFNPTEILTGRMEPIDLVITMAAFVLPIAWALVVFPRRDLAAPA